MYYKTLDPAEIAELLTDTRKRPAAALTCCISNGKYQVGIADKDVQGYTPTGIVLPTHNFDQAEKIVDVANLILFPNRQAAESMEIVLSTMRAH